MQKAGDEEMKLLIIISIILISCTSISKKNHEVTIFLMENPDSLSSFVNNNERVNVLSQYSKDFKDTNTIKERIRKIRELKNSGYYLLDEFFGPYIVNDKKTGIELDFFCYKSKSEEKFITFKFDNSENGKWKLDYISIDKPYIVEPQKK